ncbi:MAG: ergothioneine biosynthesis protein EgtB [Leptolyngbya sp. SIO1E4]|nr:ergothioneine biosynthesis protein EgtB [Leptolyngbya sp. SIO1E4]
MAACRQSTLKLLDQLTEAEFCQQVHPDFSPVGWHLGHIAFTESLWLLEHLKEDPCPYPHYQTLFAADGLPKAERENLPVLPDILALLQDIRDRTFAYLETAPLYDQLRLWRWVVQHESQHAETATFLLALHRWTHAAPQTVTAAANVQAVQPSPELGSTANMVLIPGGEFEMGSDSLDALDNERPAHRVTVADYWCDRTPVTVAEYAAFIAAGGYHNSQWWHPAGWAWVQKHGITQPLYWRTDPDWGETPVCGVSWYEADAYSCFVGKRLPTEAEWERAACWQPNHTQKQPYPWGQELPTASRCNFGDQQGGPTPVGIYPAGRSATGCEDLLGNVWEWTHSWFEGHAEFVPYPYEGYSQVYFDRAHRVLRGGSWATRPWVLRSTFRNWYHPSVRQLFSGFRCVLSA